MKIHMPRSIAFELIQKQLRPGMLPLNCTLPTAIRQPDEKDRVPLLHVTAELRGFHMSTLEVRRDWSTARYENMLRAAERYELPIVNNREVAVDLQGETIGLVSKKEVMVKMQTIDDIMLVPIYRLARMWLHTTGPMFDWAIAALEYIGTSVADEDPDIDIEWSVSSASKIGRFASEIQDAGAILPYRLTGPVEAPEGKWRDSVTPETLHWVQEYDKDELSLDSAVDILFPDAIDWTNMQNGYIKGEYVEAVLAASINELRRMWLCGEFRLRKDASTSYTVRQFLDACRVEQHSFPGMEGMVPDPFGALTGA